MRYPEKSLTNDVRFFSQVGLFAFTLTDYTTGYRTSPFERKLRAKTIVYILCFSSLKKMPATQRSKIPSLLKVTKVLRHLLFQ
jgi:hypothetical protein